MTTTVSHTTSGLDDEVNLLMSPGDPNRWEISQDPYPLYARLRAEAPAYRHEASGTWIFSRHEDSLALLKSTDFTSDIVKRWQAAAGEGVELNLSPAQRLIANGMFWRDPPEHTRLRVLIQGAFRPSAIQSWVPRVEEIAAELLDDLRQRETFDLLHDFTLQLPARIITEMIGMPIDMLDKYSSWSKALVGIQEPTNTPEQIDYYDGLATECLDYVNELTNEKRQNPGNDIVSHLLECSRQEDLNITQDEIVGLVVILNAGGQETTANAISNGMLALLRHPDQYRMLREDLSLLPGAVSEVLRYDTPARLLNRYAKVRTQVGDTTVEPGETVFGLLGSAHRDERVVSEPDRFDIARRDPKSMLFGFGPHFCVGSRLAIAETQASLRLLMTTFPDGLALAVDQPTWKDSLMIRGLDALPVATGG